MKTIFLKKRVLQTLTLLILSICSFFLFACKTKVNYFNYVSELRNNVFWAKTEEYSLRIYSVKKEVPYKTDGIPKELSTRTEFYFLPSSGEKSCSLSFQIDGKDYGGEMSYDNVKAEYYYSCSLDTSALQKITCSITYDKEIVQLNALSVLTSSTVTPQSALQNVIHEEKELFNSMTDKYGFAGEIYIRLIYEDACYYYVGVIDREEKIHAFLLNAQTGKILAKRLS